MDEETARAKLSDLVAATVFPALEPATLERLLKSARRADINGYIPSDDVEWAPNTEYTVDQLVVPTSRNGRVYRVTVAGTSGAEQPVWPTNGIVVADGVTYEEVSASHSIWINTYDFNRAAAEGWRIKAGMVSNRHSFGSNGGNYNPEQLFDHCMKMAELYANKGVAAIAVRSGHWTGRGKIPGAHLEDAT